MLIGSTILSAIAAAKSSVILAAKVTLAAGPIALPLVIAGSVGALLFMDKAATKTANILINTTHE